MCVFVVFSLILYFKSHCRFFHLNVANVEYIVFLILVICALK